MSNSPDPIPQLQSPKALAAERVRLHITPFTPALFKTFIPPTLQASATNISYHTLETLPERAFGYVELPAMDAQKLKKKFNGTILKGTKVRVEEARPERKRKAVDDEVEDEEKPSTHKKKVKKDKGEVVGVVLEDGRSVKRGWTETPAESKKSKSDRKENKTKEKGKDSSNKREPSKYTNDPECLFRTELPLNVAANADEKKKKKKKKGEKGTVVHEFEQTQKHASFLKSGKIGADTKVASEYVDGKGWVDTDGDVVEGETEAQRIKRERKEQKRARRAKGLEEAQAREEVEEEPVPAATPEPVEKNQKKKERKGEVTVSAGSDSKPAFTPEATNSSVKKPAARLHIPGTNIPDMTSSADKPIHPLESLYKAVGPTSTAASPARPAPIQTSFSFSFGRGGNNEEEEEEEEDDDDDDGSSDVDDTMMTENIPQTPFTQRDMEWRGMRSAAPTPDTAAINRKFSFSMGRIEEDEDSDEEMGNATGEYDASAGTIDANFETGKGLGISNEVSAGKDGDKEESEFAKWFWENRGDTNRAWRRRRREAMKVKRKRENRRLNRRVV